MNEQLVLFPMGPSVRRFLGISPDLYRGDLEPDVSEPLLQAFVRKFDEAIRDVQCLDNAMLTDLVEELVGMDCAFLAVRLADAYPLQWSDDDFRFCFHFGNALMMVGDCLRAEQYLLKANKLFPEEPAPYVNLSQVYYQIGQKALAENWLKSGVHVAPNHAKLWEWLVRCGAHENAISELADASKSWVGTSLSCEMLWPGDIERKVLSLYRLKDLYAHDPEYLEELTGQLGLLGQYDRVWEELAPFFEVEKNSEKQSESSNWKLYIHAAQALLQVGRIEEAKSFWQKASRSEQLAESGRHSLDLLKQDIFSEHVL